MSYDLIKLREATVNLMGPPRKKEIKPEEPKPEERHTGFRCPKCRENRFPASLGTTTQTTKTNKHITKTKCGECGTNIVRFVKFSKQ